MYYSATLSQISPEDTELVNQGVHALNAQKSKSSVNSRLAIFEYLRKLGMDEQAAGLRADAVIQVIIYIFYLICKHVLNIFFGCIFDL